MKQLLILLCCLALMAIDISAQVFAPLGAEWKILNNSALAYFLCDDPDYMSINTVIVDRQEQIDGKTVNVLVDGVSEMKLWIDSGRIYFYEDDSFYLHMDMNLVVGDTLIQQYPETNLLGTSCACSFNEMYRVFGIVRKDSAVVVSGDSLHQLYFDYYSYHSEDTSQNLSFEGSAFFTEKLGFNNYGIGYKGPSICTLGECCDNTLLCYNDNRITYDFSNLSENCIYTSISEPENFKINTYPNPVNNTWYIQSEKSDSVSFYEISGKQILQTQIQTGTNAVDFSGLNARVYFYHIIDGSSSVIKRGKLVKAFY